MDKFSFIIVGGLIIAILLGMMLGFGRCLKMVTGGIVGIIFSVFLCIVFGGVIANIPFVASLITKGNEYFGSKAAILAKMNIATLIYYVILFFVSQIVRIIAVKAVAKLFTPKNKESKVFKVRKVINKALGVILLGGFYILLVYLVLASVKLFSDVETVSSTLQSFEESGKFSVFYSMYKWNPIDLYTLFK